MYERGVLGGWCDDRKPPTTTTRTEITYDIAYRMINKEVSLIFLIFKGICTMMQKKQLKLKLKNVQ
jgi:hypothetical protein